MIARWAPRRCGVRGRKRSGVEVERSPTKTPGTVALDILPILGFKRPGRFQDATPLPEVEAGALVVVVLTLPVLGRARPGHEVGEGGMRLIGDARPESPAGGAPSQKNPMTPTDVGESRSPSRRRPHETIRGLAGWASHPVASRPSSADSAAEDRVDCTRKRDGVRAPPHREVGRRSLARDHRSKRRYCFQAMCVLASSLPREMTSVVDVSLVLTMTV